MYCFLKYIDYEEFLQYEEFNKRQMEKSNKVGKKLSKRTASEGTASFSNKSDTKFNIKKIEKSSFASMMKSTSTITYYDDSVTDYDEYLQPIAEKSSKNSTLKDASVNTVEEIEEVAPVFENKELVFNPNCFIKLILDYIFSTLKISDPEVQKNLDFCSTRGYLCNIQTYNSNRSGLDVFQPKGRYYIVLPDLDINGRLKGAKPLLSVTSIEYEEFQMRKIRRSVRSSSSLLASSSQSMTKRRKSGSKVFSKTGSAITSNTNK